MRLEYIKSVILFMLILSSLALSFTLWTGVRQYEAMPSWILKTATVSTSNDPVDQPEVTDIEDEKLLNSLLKPEKMVEHNPNSRRLYFVNSSTFASTAWQKLNTSLKKGANVSIINVSLSEWSEIVNNGSYEFIFTGSYPIDIMFPNWNLEHEEQDIKIERLLVSTSEEPVLYARSLNYRQLYKIEFNSIEWPENGIKTFNGSSADKGWRVFDGGYNNEQILSGVYLPANFVANYGGDFPEIFMTAETYETKKWVSVFFTNTSLAREISLKNNKYLYSLSNTSLEIDYNKAPHIQYSYIVLNEQDVEKTYEEAFLKSSVFIAKHSYANWPKFDTDVLLTRALSKNNKRTFFYNCYTTDLKYNVPVQSTMPAFSVQSENGVITEMSRQVWNYGRKHTLPKINIEAMEAIERLSLDKWKIATEENPYAVEVVEKFQQYLADGYKISDVSICYYNDQNLTTNIYISPYWAVTLTNSNGTAIRFFVNALTEYIPKVNGLIVE